MQFNQTNNNAGDVNNAISLKGGVVQNVGGRDHSTAYTDGGQIADALKALRPLLSQVAEDRRVAVEAALDKLIEAARKDIPVAQVAPAVEQVAGASPTLWERLKEIAGKVGADLASSALLQALKSYFGL